MLYETCYVAEQLRMPPVPCASIEEMSPIWRRLLFVYFTQARSARGMLEHERTMMMLRETRARYADAT